MSIFHSAYILTIRVVVFKDTYGLIPCVPLFNTELAYFLQGVDVLNKCYLFGNKYFVWIDISVSKQDQDIQGTN